MLGVRRSGVRNVLVEQLHFSVAIFAYEGRWLGAETFVSFDRKAVETLAAQGVTARLL